MQYFEHFPRITSDVWQSAKQNHNPFMINVHPLMLWKINLKNIMLHLLLVDLKTSDIVGVNARHLLKKLCAAITLLYPCGLLCSELPRLVFWNLKLPFSNFTWASRCLMVDRKGKIRS